MKKIEQGEIRLKEFGVKEKKRGKDKGEIKKKDRSEGDEFIINGKKIWKRREE